MIKMAMVVRMMAMVLFMAAAASAQPTKRDVDVRALDGTLLKATYFSPGKPGPGVILLPMCNSHRKAWENAGTMLAARGIHTITMDYRGFGDSGPKREADMTLAERQQARGNWADDIYEVLKHLAAQPGVNRNLMGAGGGSCGVENALQLAQRRLEVKTLVLLAGGASPNSQQYLAESAWLPVFAAAAHDDGNIVDTMKWLVGFSSHSASVLKEYPTGGHGTDMFAVHKDLEPAIATWFEQHLIKSPVQTGTALGPGGSSARFAERVRQPGGAAQVIEELKRARAEGRSYPLPPEAAINSLGQERVQSGNAKDAEMVYALTIEAYPKTYSGHFGLAQAKFAQRNYEGAAASYTRAIEAGDPGFIVHNDLASMQLYMGRTEEALKGYQRALEIAIKAGQAGLGHFLVARGYARMGEKDKAFESLNQAIAAGYANRGPFEGDQHLASIRNDPRFQELRARLR